MYTALRYLGRKRAVVCLNASVVVVYRQDIKRYWRILQSSTFSEYHLFIIWRIQVSVVVCRQDIKRYWRILQSSSFSEYHLFSNWRIQVSVVVCRQDIKRYWRILQSSIFFWPFSNWMIQVCRPPYNTEGYGVARACRARKVEKERVPPRSARNIFAAFLNLEWIVRNGWGLVRALIGFSYEV